MNNTLLLNRNLNKVIFHPIYRKRNGIAIYLDIKNRYIKDRILEVLHGDRGTIILEEGRITTWKLADASPTEEEQMLNLEQSLGSGSADPTAIGYELHRRQLADLIEAIREDRPPAIEGAEACKALAIISAIYQSSQKRMVIKLPVE